MRDSCYFPLWRITREIPLRANQRTTVSRVTMLFSLTNEPQEATACVCGSVTSFRWCVVHMDQTGNRVNSTRMSFETSLDRSKITDSVWHDLRHTFATRTLSKGMRIEYLSKILGHSKISTTEKYAHVLPSDLHDAMQAVAL